MRNSYILVLILAFLTSLLLSIGWPPLPLAPLLFIGFVPLLIAENLSSQKRIGSYFFLTICYCAMVIWNILTTMWIYNTSFKGGLLAHLVNPFVLILPFVIYKLSSRVYSQPKRYIILIGSWLSMEYFHHHWDLAFPFLTLGNGLAMHPPLIQFYEYTGVLGGSLWILLINILAFDIIKRFYLDKSDKKREINIGAFLPIALTTTLPIIISFWIYRNYKEVGKPVEVVAIHPNIDCRKEKYAVNAIDLIPKYLKLSKELVTQNTDYLIWPETAIPKPIWLAGLNKEKIIDSIKNGLLKEFPNVKLISGAVLCEVFQTKDSNTDPPDNPNIRYNAEYDYWYYTYNSAFQLSESEQSILVRTKKKLVPIEETIPFARNFKFLRKIVKSLGGYSFATRETNNNIFRSKNGLSVTPLICYESVFGTLAREYVDEGANLLFVILNEGWYKSHQGSSQFMYYASIRAIENRRSIARSSNDGITSFINQKGDIISQIDEYKGGSLRASLLSNKRKTIYTIFGDYIGLLAATITGVMLLILITQKFKYRKLSA